MREAICIIRRYETMDGLKYWGTVRIDTLPKDRDLYFSYDTTFFDIIEEARAECKAFCIWKNLKVKKWIMDIGTKAKYQ